MCVRSMSEYKSHATSQNIEEIFLTSSSVYEQYFRNYKLVVSISNSRKINWGWFTIHRITLHIR
jgi:hypothetical protein